MFWFWFGFIITFIIAVPIMMIKLLCTHCDNKEESEKLVIVDNETQLDELNDPVSTIEAEIMAQEELVDMYYKYWLHEDEKFRSVPEYKKETDDYYKKWKSAQEAKARYLKADARLAKLKEKSGVDYVINL